LDFVQRSFSEPYTRFVAASSRLFLNLIGVEAHGAGSIITSPRFTVNILYVCNGIEATAIFFATILGFPAPWKNKLLGLALGYPLIYLINILRIAALFIIGYKMPQIFETVHYYYAQAFVILATVCVWLLWVSKYSAYGSKSSDNPVG
jgi:exosortase H (IPTLxxWG-CTERM-specific)